MKIHILAMAACCAIAMFGGPTPASAQSTGLKPAVDGWNGKASFQGGRFDGDDAYFGAGSLSFPVTHETGIQLDGAAGRVGGNLSFTLGGHAFWRDPDRFLIGIRGLYARTPGLDFSIYRISLETDLYLGRWSMQSNIGFQGGDIEHGPFGRALLSWYLQDNLRLRAGFQLAAGESSNLALADVEYQLPFKSLHGTALFFGTAFGQDSYAEVIGGIRFYLNPGKRKTLIRRHREDDPDGAGGEGTGTVTGGGNDEQSRPPRCISPRRLERGVCRLVIVGL